jgi:ribosomal protein S27AE
VITLAVTLIAPQPRSSWQFYAPQLVLALIWLAVVVRIGYIANEHLKCPKCNQVIWLEGNDYSLDPKVCPKCGVVLK